jgi:hypothetical protein
MNLKELYEFTEPYFSDQLGYAEAYRKACLEKGGNWNDTKACIALNDYILGAFHSNEKPPRRKGVLTQEALRYSLKYMRFEEMYKKYLVERINYRSANAWFQQAKKEVSFPCGLRVSRYLTTWKNEYGWDLIEDECTEKWKEHSPIYKGQKLYEFTEPYFNEKISYAEAYRKACLEKGGVWSDGTACQLLCLYISKKVSNKPPRRKGKLTPEAMQYSVRYLRFKEHYANYLAQRPYYESAGAWYMEYSGGYPPERVTEFLTFFRKQGWSLLEESLREAKVLRGAYAQALPFYQKNLHVREIREELRIRNIRINHATMLKRCQILGIPLCYRGKHFARRFIDRNKAQVIRAIIVRNSLRTEAYKEIVGKYPELSGYSFCSILEICKTHTPGESYIMLRKEPQKTFTMAA